MFICVHLWLTPLLFAADLPEPKFRHQTIDDKIEIGYGVAAADVDGDGKTDILLADKRQFVWYRNPTWEKFVIAENLTKRDNVCLAAQDLDGDGKCELAVGGDWAPEDRETSGAVFYMIPPADRTQKWEPVKLHAEPTVHRMRWVQVDDRQWGLVIAPLHGRGKDGGAGARILLYRKPADPRMRWETALITDELHATHNFEVMPHLGVAVACREGIVEVMFGKKQRKLLPDSQPSGEVRFAWNGIAAIEPMHGNRLVVFSLADDSRHVLTETMSEGHALAMGRLTGVNSEIVVGWRGKGGGVRLFTSLSCRLDQWRQTIIDDGGMACEDLCLADLDADGKLDIVASGRATKNVKIYWNETPTPPK